MVVALEAECLCYDQTRGKVSRWAFVAQIFTKLTPSKTARLEESWEPDQNCPSSLHSMNHSKDKAAHCWFFYICFIILALVPKEQV